MKAKIKGLVSFFFFLRSLKTKSNALKRLDKGKSL